MAEIVIGEPARGAGLVLPELVTVAYYRARTPEYLDCALHAPGGNELEEALDAFAPGGVVLELACGPASWTPRLLRYAASVTAVNASPEMLALARERVGDDGRVRFGCADLFAWPPERRYDVVSSGSAPACPARAFRRVLGARL